MSAFSNLSKIWRNIRFPTKSKLYKALHVSILLYGCESWTLTVDLEKKIEAFEMKGLLRCLGIKINEFVRNNVTALTEPHEPLLATYTVKKRKLTWFGHVTRHNTLAKTISCRAPYGRRKKERQTEKELDRECQRTGRPSSCQHFSRRQRADRGGEDSQPYHPSCPPPRPSKGVIGLR